MRRGGVATLVVAECVLQYLEEGDVMNILGMARACLPVSAFVRCVWVCVSGGWVRGCGRVSGWAGGRVGGCGWVYYVYICKYAYYVYICKHGWVGGCGWVCYVYICKYAFYLPMYCLQIHMHRGVTTVVAKSREINQTALGGWPKMNFWEFATVDFLGVTEFTTVWEE